MTDDQRPDDTTPMTCDHCGETVPRADYLTHTSAHQFETATTDASTNDYATGKKRLNEYFMDKFLPDLIMLRRRAVDGKITRVEADMGIMLSTLCATMANPTPLLLRSLSDEVVTWGERVLLPLADELIRRLNEQYGEAAVREMMEMADRAMGGRRYDA